MRLLVIEDDATLRESLATQLATNGFGVEQAADGREGLYFALEYPVDLAIIDLGLPEMSGLDIIKALRAKGKTYPILILTARDRWQDKVDGLSAGADDYVVKPFTSRKSARGSTPCCGAPVAGPRRSSRPGRSNSTCSARKCR